MPRAACEEVGPLKLARADVERQSPRDPVRFQSAIIDATSAITHSPISAMMPVCSAIGMKVSGWRMPVARVVPAQQRLGPGDLATDEAQLRLHRQHEFAALDGLAQRDFGVDLGRCSSASARRTGNIGSPPLSLARYIAMSAARIRLSMLRAVVGGHRDPDRRTDVDAVAVQLERLADRQCDSPRDALGIVGVASSTRRS